MYIIDRLAYDAVRGQVRSYKRSRSRKGGPNTAAAWVTVAVVFLLMWPVADLLLSGHYLAVFLLVAVPSIGYGVLLGVLRQGGGPGSRKVLDRYQDRTGKLSDADRMRLRAEAAEDTAAARQAVYSRFGLVDPFAPAPEPEPGPEPEPVSAAVHLPDGLERQRNMSMLFMVPCREPACQAAVTVPCNMGLGIPVAIVDKVRIKFCHLARITDAVEAGFISREQVLAQFGVSAPEGART